MAFLIYAFTAAAATLIWVVIKAWRINRHWANLGVPYPKPVLFFGNHLDLVLRRRTQPQIIADIYNEFPNEPVVGYYHFLTPRLIIRDQSLIEHVLIRDFPHFVDRMPFINPNNALVLNLFNLTGNHWRAMRTKLVPMFTTGKLRHMLPQVNKLSDELMKLLEKHKNEVILKDKISRFAMEVISSTAFGIEPGSLDGEESRFSKESKFAFSADFLVTMQRLFLFSFPKVATALKMGFMPTRTVSYFTGIIRSALQHRRSTGLTRNDFVQQMVTLLDKGYVEYEKNDPSDDYLKITDKAQEDSFKIELTDDVMIGHAFVFLLAGFETTSTAMTYLCFDLAVNEKAQDEARKEVLEAVKRHGELTYDKLRELNYLEGCLKESLRIHPPVGHLIRNCTKKYVVPGTNITVEPNTVVSIPSLGIHMNPDIYPRPDEYLPERWIDNVGYPACSFLPFGDGPRICIGMRFAIMEIKCCMAKLLQQYTISLHPSVDLPIKSDPFSFFGGPIKPILFNITRIES